MDALIKAVETTPIIDHHAHNLLLASEVDHHDFMAATSEATGPALKFVKSTLSHLRALKQLSKILKCESTWEAVEGALKVKRKEHDNAWARKCFHGIEMVLIDDGLNPSSVYQYDWHDRLTQSKCKRIVRIEKVAENIMTNLLGQYGSMVPGKGVKIQEQIIKRFTAAIEEALSDPEVAGFKSVICYRVGLKIPAFDGNASVAPLSIEDLERLSRRLEDESLNPYLVHLTAKVIERSGSRKPLQFHTGVRTQTRTIYHKNNVNPSCSSSETMSTSSQKHLSRSDCFVDYLVASIWDCLIPVTSKPSLRVTRKFVSFFSMLLILSQERRATSQASIKTAGLILEKSSQWSVSTGKRRSLNRLWNFVHPRKWRGALVSFPVIFHY